MLFGRDYHSSFPPYLLYYAVKTMNDIEKMVQAKPDVLNVSFKKVPSLPDSIWQSVQLTKLVLAGK